jgi:hypothetical protein
LSDDRYARHNGKSVIRMRLTEETDMTSVSGLKKAGELVKPYLGKVPIFLWGSLPCTLACSFQQIDKLRSSRWEARKTFLTKQVIALHDSFLALAELISSYAGGHVAHWVFVLEGASNSFHNKYV